MTTGYATTPLADELGLKPGMRVFTADLPDNVRATAALDDLGLELLAAPCTGIDAALVFVTDQATLDRELAALRQLIAPGGFIWASCPADEDAGVTPLSIRDAAAPLSLVEAKRCAITPGWTGLKLMIG